MRARDSNADINTDINTDGPRRMSLDGFVRLPIGVRRPRTPLDVSGHGGANSANAFLEAHSWDAHAAWHLGLTEGAGDETKARYGFVYGDFRRVHRTALIACVYRASEWRHKEVELAAHDLLQLLDRTSG